MKQHLRSVAKRLGAVLAKLRQRRMIEEFQEYGATGKEPQSELGKAYVDLTEAFGRVADASIGGKGYEQAVEAYRAAEERYEQASREVVL